MEIKVMKILLIVFGVFVILWFFYIVCFIVKMVIRGFWEFFSSFLNVVFIIIILNGCVNFVIYVI